MQQGREVEASSSAYPWVGCLRFGHTAVEDLDGDPGDGWLDVRRLDGAFYTPWPDERFFVSYQVANGSAENPWPRMRN